jgi:hypothetical protein
MIVYLRVERDRGLRDGVALIVHFPFFVLVGAMRILAEAVFPFELSLFGGIW